MLKKKCIDLANRQLGADYLSRRVFMEIDFPPRACVSARKDARTERVRSRL
jgi:hypothetical protein